MDNFIEEVKEEVRTDQIMALWKKYGASIIKLFLIIIVSLTCYIIWDVYQGKKLQKQTLLYEQVIKNIDTNLTSDNNEILKLINTGSQGYKILATFMDNSSNKIENLKKITTNNSIDSFYKSLVKIKIAIILIKNKNQSEAIEYLRDIKYLPLVPIALELQAITELANATQEEKTKIAQELQQKLANKQMPKSLNTRIRALIEINS